MKQAKFYASSLNWMMKDLNIFLSVMERTIKVVELWQVLTVFMHFSLDL